MVALTTCAFVSFNGVRLGVTENVEVSTILIGNNIVYANSGTGSANTTYVKIFTAINSGVSNTGYLYINISDTDDSILLIYDSSNNLLATSDAKTSVSAGWNEYTFSGANKINISKGTQYKLGILFSGDIAVNTLSTGSQYQYQLSTTYPTPPNPFVSGGNSGTMRDLSLYIKS